MLADSLLRAGSGALQREPSEMRLAGALCAAQALGLRQHAVRVDLALEAGQERRAGLGGRLARIVARMQGVGTDPSPERHVARVKPARTVVLRTKTHGSPNRASPA